MELVYLWVDKLKAFENFDSSLNPKFIIAAKPVLTKENILKIDLKTNKDYNHIFGENINIIAVVGKNGSGKSNFVDTIYSIIQAHNPNVKTSEKSYGNIKDVPKKYCLVFRYNNNFFAYINGIIDTELKIDKKYVECTMIKDKRIRKQNSQIAKFQTFLRLSENKQYIVDNIEQKNRLQFKLNNYFYFDRFNTNDTIDAIKKLLSNNDFELFKNFPFFKFEYMGLEYNINDAIYHMNDDLIKYKTYLKLTHPNNLIRRLNYTTRRFMCNKLDEIFLEKRLELFIHNHLPILCFEMVLLKVLNLLNTEEYAKTKKENNFYLEDFLTSVVDAQDEYEKHYIDYWNVSSRLKFYNSLKEVITKQYKIIISPPIWTFKNYQASSIIQFIDLVIDYENNIKGIKSLIENCLEIIDDNKEAIIRVKKDFLLKTNKYSMEYSKLSKQERMLYGMESLLVKIFNINFYKESKKDTFTFKQLSTGEQRMLMFFGTLMQIIEYNKFENTKQPVQTFIFDEMDLSWHPEWQRNMVYYITEIFKNSDTFCNLILTTHSPFILSDMPRTNVILLKKENNRTVCCDKFNQTFASNIHKLLYDSFFIDNNISKFAEIKIQEAINIINNSKSLKQDLEKAHCTINIIGEELIRKMLEAQYKRNLNA